MFRIPDPDVLLTERETATLLGWEVTKLRSYRLRRLIGSITLGRDILHSGAHIRQLIESCETTAKASPPTGNSGSASGQEATHGTEHGSIPESVRQGASALARRTFAPRMKVSRSGGLSIAD